MIIKCAKNNGELEFSERDGLRLTNGSEHFAVTIRAFDLSAYSRVYAWTPFNGIVQFFQDLAENWKGWNGQKKWNSLEGELSLTCTRDGVGHIEIEVTLFNIWNVTNSLYVEAGQLQQIATEAEKFFTV